MHAIDGRIRLKVPEIKKCPQKAQSVTRAIEKMDGIYDVQANPLTGSVLVNFNPDTTDSVRILSRLRRAGYLADSAGMQENMVNFFIKAALELAIQQALFGWI